MKLLLIAVLIAAMALTFASCGNGNTTQSETPATAAPAESGTGEQTESAPAESTPPEAEKTEIGEGKTTIVVTVKDGDTSTEFTIHTDAENLADALTGTEPKIAEGQDSEYGLYITTVNGKTADDTHFWSIEQNGEMLMTGASSTPISDGEAFELVWTELTLN